MAIQTADVINLKCIYFGAISRKIDTETYSVLCKEETITTLIEDIKLLLFLYQISPTVCRTLECKILEILETYSDYCIYCDDPCAREYSATNSE